MKNGYKRFQFDFSEEAVRRLKRLGDQTESATNAEVVRRSLKFYEYVIKMLGEGYSLEFDKEGKKIVVPGDLL